MRCNSTESHTQYERPDAYHSAFGRMCYVRIGIHSDYGSSIAFDLVFVNVEVIFDGVTQLAHFVDNPVRAMFVEFSGLGVPPSATQAI